MTLIRVVRQLTKGAWIEIPVSKSMWRLVAVAAAAIADAEEELS